MRPALPAPEYLTLPLSDGYEGFARAWFPSADRKNSSLGIIYLHGIQSHGGWYEWSGSLLTAISGAPLLMPDRRGSGRNAVARGDAVSAGQLFEDLQTQIDWLRRTAGVARIALVGVSWGGKLAAAFVDHDPRAVADLLLIAPGVYPAIDVSLTRKASIVLSYLAGGHTYYPIPLGDPALFTQNPAGQRYIADDSLKLEQATARFLVTSAELDRRARRARSSPVRANLLLAESDAIIRNAETRRWFERRFAERGAVRTLPGAHTLEFETDERAYAAALADWAGGLAAS